MTGWHLGEDAELYALGMLEASERRAFDRHLAECEDCTVRVAQAEAAVANMIDATVDPVHAPARLQTGFKPPARRWIAAAAAVAFAIVTAASLQQNVQLHADVRADAVVLRTLVDSHFSHAQFISPDGMPVPAKVVYERHGRWFEVFAHDIDPRARVIVIAGRRQTPYMQSFLARAGVFILTLPALGPIDELRLVDSRGRAIGHAGLSFAK